MADEAIIDIRLSNIERDCSEIKNGVKEIDDRLDNHSERLNDLEHWYHGNEAKGAEKRLQCVEDYKIEMETANIRTRTNMLEAEMVAVQKIADHAILEGVQGAVNDTLDTRSRTFIEKVKAWGPIVSAALAATAIVLAAVL